ncbi:MAG: FAD-dependent oxidoreductase [Lachnospiraceae bacterium]|nr:FAD-dependent oxidoreductase [Lachnospiraceae bacterium]
MKYLILGAGPSGLSFANRLLSCGEQDFLVLEAQEDAGGLCRSRDVDGSPLDIGGGHFLDVRDQKVLSFLFPFMDESEWDLYDRNSRIVVNGNEINSPIEANIWQMKLEDQVEYLKSIAVAGCNLGEEMPEKFVDWIYWKLGGKIAKDYMIPYNQKMFGQDLNALGTYWLNKLPNVSFEETLISCLEKKAYGKQPAHAKFYYPKKYGYGELWKRMADALGEKIKYNTPVRSIDFENRTVNDTFSADRIILTIPWKNVEKLAGVPEEHMQRIADLKYSSVVITYYPEHMDTPAHWIYYPDPALSYHRILVRHNFCPGSKGYWTETNLNRFSADENRGREYFVNDFAYPLNTMGKEENMAELLKWAETKNVFGLGRWGEWQHYNSDVVVSRAMDLADQLQGK